MRTTVPSTHLAAPPRIDLTKRITPVLTHHGRTLARFSDRATAVRRAREWGGCIVGATFTDAGTLRNATPVGAAGYRRAVPYHPGYVHPDRIVADWRATWTARNGNPADGTFYGMTRAGVVEAIRRGDHYPGTAITVRPTV